MVEKKIEGARLRQPIDLSFAPNDKGQEDYVVDVVLKTLKAAKSPVVLVDACVDRHRASEETHEFIARSGLPTFVAPMGKGIIQESLPEFRGVYAGDASHPDVRELVENSDLVISIGTIKSGIAASQVLSREVAQVCYRFQYGWLLISHRHPVDH